MDLSYKEFLIKILLYVFSLFLNSMYAFSAEETSDAEKVVKDSKNFTSEENRKHLNYQMTIAFVGLEYSTSPPLTFSASYFLSPDSLLTLRYTNINTDNEKLRATALGYRHFLGNSFNVMPTAGWRRTTGSHVSSLSPARFVYEDIAAGIRISNEWQWENFTLGCDWIGVNKTIVKLHSTDGGGIVSGGIKKATTYTVSSFYLGYSF